MLRRKPLALLIALLAANGAFAQSLPSGGSFTMGNGNITAGPDGKSVNVDVTGAGANGKNAMITWSGGFNVGPGYSTNFNSAVPGLKNLVNFDASGQYSNISGSVNIGNIPNWILVNPNGISLGTMSRFNAAPGNSAWLFAGTATPQASGDVRIDLGTAGVSLLPRPGLPGQVTLNTSQAILGTVESGITFGADGTGTAYAPYQLPHQETSQTGYFAGGLTYAPIDLSGLPADAVFRTPNSGNVAVISTEGQRIHVSNGSVLGLAEGAGVSAEVVAHGVQYGRVQTHGNAEVKRLTVGAVSSSDIRVKVREDVVLNDVRPRTYTAEEQLAVAQSEGYPDVQSMLDAYGAADFEDFALSNLSSGLTQLGPNTRLHATLADGSRFKVLDGQGNPQILNLAEVAA